MFGALAYVLVQPGNPLVRERRVFAGPDTDTIGAEDRFDGCHMAESGLQKHAEMWLACILNAHQAVL